jgi:hypothetical protein
MRVSRWLVVVAVTMWTLGCGGGEDLAEPVPDADADDVTPHVDPFMPSDEPLEVAFSADDLAGFERVDGFVVSPVLEAGTALARVLVDAEVEAGASPRFELSADTRAWTPLRSEFSEDGLVIAVAEVAGAKGVRLRWPVDARVTAVRITGFDGLDEEPVVVDEVGSTEQALSSAFSGLGVQPRSAWGAGASASSTDKTRKYRAAVHHTVTRPDVGPSAIRHILALHRARGFKDVGYHFLITRDGTIWEGRPVDRIGAHAAGSGRNENPGNVGIVLVGCFEPGRDCDAVDRTGLRTPTDAMLRSLSKLLGTTARTFGFPIDRARIKGHQEWIPRHTACPGRTTMQRLDSVVAQARSSGSTGAPPPTPITGCGRLSPGQTLGRNQSVRSCDGRYALVMQADGNLVLYRSGRALWSTSTHGRGGSVATLQRDGNFVVYTPGGTPLWNSGTHRYPGSWLAVQDDGNVVIYSGRTPRWATYTQGR